jgi:mRNA interferase MazF
MPNYFNQKQRRWIKDFDTWNETKKSLDKRRKIPKFSERDIWFISVGTNVGSETDGKNHEFERPVLIVKKYSDGVFFGLPMTTVARDGNWYYTLRTKGYKSVVILNQGRVFSAKRLIRRVKYHVTTNEFDNIRQKLKDSL